MEWLTANWFWMVIFIAFIAMHLFGHGGHGGHGGGDNRSMGDRENDDASSRVPATSTAGISTERRMG